MEFSRSHSDHQQAPKLNRGGSVRIKIFILMVLFFALGFVSAYHVKRFSDDTPAYALPQQEKLQTIPEFNTDLYARVYAAIKDTYVDPRKISDKELFYGALRGMVDALGDPYTVYLDPVTHEEFTEELDGSFDGIGAEIGIKDDRLTIIAPLANSPAQSAGLRPGDIIVAIDEESALGLTLDEAIARIRGTAGTTVALTIFRSGEEGTKQISITRQKIVIPSAQLLIEDSIAIISLYNFNNESEKQLVQSLMSIGNQEIQGVILDVRNNPGGFLDKAVRITSAWLEPGQVVVREVYRNDSLSTAHEAVRQARAPKVPTIVLVNEGSASASEILAGALQDYGVARLLGTTTYGKGSVQDLMSLPDGSGIKVTIAQWLTPLGRIINETGISPDIEVRMTAEDYANERDPQLERAKQILKGEAVE